MAEFIYFVVYRKIFFYIGIGTRNIRFGLVIIVIRHEKLHAVIREKGAELVAKLGGKRFVVRDHERGAVYVRYNVSHSKRLARTGNAQKDLRAKSVVDSFGQKFNSLRLVARRLKFRS